ncbi:putative carboxylesterase [Halenospora varia]|nr:putative carboxylesterase [Halenospora varia]
MWSLLTTAICLAPFTLAAPAEKRSAGPSVTLQSATVVGSSSLGIDSFKGIPYAQPPVGNLRLKPPQPITTNLGTVTATGQPRACPQTFTSLNTTNVPNDIITLLTETPFFQAASNQGEDCLTISKPSTATANSNLPVVFWIFGGGFEFGSTQTYDASEFISTSVSQGKPVIYVSVNYRVGGFGFLGGSEILKDGSANLGLLDQRLGLQWTADNIAAFGGDPSKVTIWGESAGAISVFDQMALYNGDNTYKGKPLFRGGIMDSGALVPADSVGSPKAQDIYNRVVSAAGCSGSSDTLACLRALPYQQFLAATQNVPAIFDYQSVALSYLPRPDGKVLTQSPEILAQNGQFASVPFIIGDQEDEGTLFSLVTYNLSTTEQLVDYLETYYFADATREQIEGLVATYPTDITAGSPFNTGLLNEIYPQYKRIAALLGDIVFTLTRRVFLNLTAQSKPDLKFWSYLASYDYGTPVLGTFHASDILTAYGITPGFASSSIQKYYINFIDGLDPNAGGVGTTWPEWKVGKQLLNFRSLNNGLVGDDFRGTSYDYIANAATSFHI